MQCITLKRLTVNDIQLLVVDNLPVHIGCFHLLTEQVLCHVVAFLFELCVYTGDFFPASTPKKLLHLHIYEWVRVCVCVRAGKLRF